MAEGPELLFFDTFSHETSEVQILFTEIMLKNYLNVTKLHIRVNKWSVSSITTEFSKGHVFLVG